MIFIKCTVTGSHMLIFFVAPNVETFLADTKQGTKFASDKINTWEEIPAGKFREESSHFYDLGVWAMKEGNQNYLLGYVS